MTVTKNISLYPRDLELLKRLQEEIGAATISATVRYLIRHWGRERGAGGGAAPVVRAGGPTATDGASTGAKD